MHSQLPVLVALLVAATALAITAKRANTPYNVVLVVGGLLISMSGILPHVPPLDPAVVFLVCLPALLFEGGITADLSAIRENAVPIGLLSTVGMLVAIAATGTAAHALLGSAWGPSLLFGVLLAVTDTVSILYAFRRASVPKRLAGIMEGESLFNDGTALVAYGVIVAIVAHHEPFSAPSVVTRLLLVSAGGLAIGLAFGLTAGFVIRRTHDPLAEIMATSALAFGTYATAEQLHASGVIAVVTAGLTVGSTMRTAVAPQSRVAIASFWEYVAFGVNTFLFLSVGLASRPGFLIGHAREIGLAVLCVFAGRAIAVYLPLALLRVFRPALAVPARWQHVFVIGNIKGALSIALALGLPESTPSRQLLVEVTFGVTFVSLVVQGLLLGRALEWLGLAQKDPVAQRVAESQGRLVAARAARQDLESLFAAGLVPRAGYDALRSEYQVTIAATERELRVLLEQHLTQGARALLAARRRLIDVERTALASARLSGLVPDDVAERLLADIDARMLQLESMIEGERTSRPSAPPRRASEGPRVSQPVGRRSEP